MKNKDKMLQLVLSDEKLSSFFEYKKEEFQSIEESLNSEIPIVVTVAKIIQDVSRNSSKSSYKEIYNELVNYLNGSIL
jgi:tellurite resistance protein